MILIFLLQIYCLQKNFARYLMWYFLLDTSQGYSISLATGSKYNKSLTICLKSSRSPRPIFTFSEDDSCQEIFPSKNVFS